jgi:hypothetical protein
MTWQLENHSAHLAGPLLAAEVNTLEPWQGLHALCLPHAPAVAASVLQAEVRELVAPNRLPLDCYVRGDDLVVTYAPSEARNIQAQLYWRAVSNAAARYAGVELILSAQTHLLDSRPALTTVSSLPDGPVLCALGETASPQRELVFHAVDCGAGGGRRFDESQPVAAWLFQPRGAVYSYVEMVYPTDYVETAVETRGDGLRLANQLFPDRLEKGVIRRARVCGVFVPRATDIASAQAAYQAFVGQPLPLTT